jgi:RNA polymerase sigma-70 factor (ECF subfamily)
MNKPDVSELYTEYSDKLTLFLKRMVGEEDAKDLVQEVFIRVMKSLDGFQGNSSISTWLYKIATNAALDKLKSASYNKQKNTITSLDFINPLKVKTRHDYDEEYNVEYHLLKEEMNQCIADYLNRLPGNYKTIFMLREYEDYSVEEIAAIMGISVDNVKIRLHRARKKLHDILLNNCTFYYDEYSKLRCDKK